jgi:glycosyltransferase involved in cell wall biosynthesis
MRVCFISREYPPDTDWGGIGTYLATLSRKLSSLGCDVVVISQSLTGKRQLKNQDGVLVARVGKSAKRYSAISRTRFAFAAFAELRKHAPLQILDTNFFGADALYSQFTRTASKTVVHLDIASADFLKSRNYSSIAEAAKFLILSKFEVLSIGMADGIISNSEWSIKNLLPWDSIKSTSRVVCIPHGMENTAGRLDQRRTNKIHRVLYVGRLERRKGVDDLLRAAENVVAKRKDIQFIFVGSDTSTSPSKGSYLSYLRDLGEEFSLTDHLVFRGRVSVEELWKEYARSDLLVMPSYRESFGFVIIEALNKGVPVVSTDVGIAPNLLKDRRAGFVITDRDLMGSTILRFFEDEGDRCRMTHHAFKVSNRFSSEIMAKKTLRFYESLID